MRCDEARGLLWPPEQPRLAREEVLAAREHLHRCEGCREYLAQDEFLLGFYRRARSVQAPQEVRERVFDALARERAARLEPAGTRSRGNPWPGLVMMAAVAFLAIVPLRSMVLTPSAETGPRATTSSESGNAFVEDFLRRAAQADHIQTADAAEVTRFLSRELGVSAEPLPLPDFDLSGAEVCIVEGVRGAVVIYKRGGHVLYHYRIPRRTSRERLPSLSEVIPSQWSREGTYPSVVTWGSEHMEEALVSSLSPGDLMEVARSLTVQG